MLAKMESNYRTRCIGMLFFIFFLICFLASILGAICGIGGGPINLVVLFFFFSMATKVAAENSLYIIFFSQITSLISSIVTKSIPDFPAPLLVVMIAGGIVGGICGRSLNRRLSEKNGRPAVSLVNACHHRNQHL